MSLLLLPDELLGDLLAIVAEDDPIDALALGVTCRRLFALARTDLSHFCLRRVFPVAPFHPSQVRAARRRVAAVARVLGGARRVQHVELALAYPPLYVLRQPLQDRDRRDAQAALLFQLFLGVMGTRPVRSLTMDGAAVRLVLPDVPVSTPADAVRELVMNDLAAERSSFSNESGEDARLTEGAEELLRQCGRSLLNLTVVERPRRDEATLGLPVTGCSMHLWFNGGVMLPALLELTVHAAFHRPAASVLATVCPSLRHFTVRGFVNRGALEPLRLPAWPHLATVTIRYVARLPAHPTGLVGFLRHRALAGGLFVEAVDFVSEEDPADGVGSEEVSFALVGMRERPWTLVVDIPLGDLQAPEA